MNKIHGYVAGSPSVAESALGARRGKGHRRWAASCVDDQPRLGCVPVTESWAMGEPASPGHGQSFPKHLHGRECSSCVRAYRGTDRVAESRGYAPPLEKN